MEQTTVFPQGTDQHQREQRLNRSTQISVVMPVPKGMMA